MPITERTLKRWRRDALKDEKGLEESEFKLERGTAYKELNKRILRMTQELLDLHLTREK